MLNVVEIFCSIQGESSYAGLPTAFVRLAACNLRCGYCDTPYSFGKGEPVSKGDVLSRVDAYRVRHVCLTGGEPMLQPDAAIDLMRSLVERGYTVTLETNGTIPLDGVPSEVVRVMDVKTPDGLGMAANDARFVKQHLHYPNLRSLTDRDQVKFVITGRGDYEWARDFIREYRLDDRVGDVLLSPAWDELDPKVLVAWILEDGLPVRLNLQLHKYVWGADVSGV